MRKARGFGWGRPRPCLVLGPSAWLPRCQPAITLQTPANMAWDVWHPGPHSSQGQAHVG